jgi:hypothetical protein
MEMLETMIGREGIVGCIVNFQLLKNDGNGRDRRDRAGGGC